jgi:hypothetical protein
MMEGLPKAVDAAHIQHGQPVSGSSSVEVSCGWWQVERAEGLPVYDENCKPVFQGRVLYKKKFLALRTRVLEEGSSSPILCLQLAPCQQQLPGFAEFLVPLSVIDPTASANSTGANSVSSCGDTTSTARDVVREPALQGEHTVRGGRVREADALGRRSSQSRWSSGSPLYHKIKKEESEEEAGAVGQRPAVSMVPLHVDLRATIAPQGDSQRSWREGSVTDWESTESEHAFVAPHQGEPQHLTHHRGRHAQQEFSVARLDHLPDGSDSKGMYVLMGNQFSPQYEAWVEARCFLDAHDTLISVLELLSKSSSKRGFKPRRTRAVSDQHAALLHRVLSTCISKLDVQTAVKYYVGRGQLSQEDGAWFDEQLSKPSVEQGILSRAAEHSKQIKCWDEWVKTSARCQVIHQLAQPAGGTSSGVQDRETLEHNYEQRSEDLNDPSKTRKLVLEYLAHKQLIVTARLYRLELTLSEYSRSKCFGYHRSYGRFSLSYTVFIYMCVCVCVCTCVLVYVCVGVCICWCVGVIAPDFHRSSHVFPMLSSTSLPCLLFLPPPLSLSLSLSLYHCPSFGPAVC